MPVLSYAHGTSAVPLTVTGKVQKFRMREIVAEALLSKRDTSLQQM